MSAPTASFVSVVSDVAWAQAERRAKADRSLAIHTFDGGWVYAAGSRDRALAQHASKPRHDGSWF